MICCFDVRSPCSSHLSPWFLGKTRATALFGGGNRRDGIETWVPW